MTTQQPQNRCGCSNTNEKPEEFDDSLFGVTSIKSKFKFQKKLNFIFTYSSSVIKQGNFLLTFLRVFDHLKVHLVPHCSSRVSDIKFCE